jgi:spore germination protein YaaH
MAVDLRHSRNRACRGWLERVLTQLEGAGVLEATRERFPVHYHVAVFPRPYAAYVAAVNPRQPVSVQDRLAYTVRSGDSLWGIARSHGTTVDDLRVANELEGSRIYVGQVLDVPVEPAGQGPVQ